VEFESPHLSDGLEPVWSGHHRSGREPPVVVHVGLAPDDRAGQLGPERWRRPAPRRLPRLGPLPRPPLPAAAVASAASSLHRGWPTPGRPRPLVTGKGRGPVVGTGPRPA
jgi:hypothetical protein